MRECSDGVVNDIFFIREDNDSISIVGWDEVLNRGMMPSRWRRFIMYIFGRDMMSPPLFDI